MTLRLALLPLPRKIILLSRTLQPRRLRTLLNMHLFARNLGFRAIAELLLYGVSVDFAAAGFDVPCYSLAAGVDVAVAFALGDCCC